MSAFGAILLMSDPCGSRFGLVRLALWGADRTSDATVFLDEGDPVALEE
jgi:hypothetical protein